MSAPRFVHRCERAGCEGGVHYFRLMVPIAPDEPEPAQTSAERAAVMLEAKRLADGEPVDIVEIVGYDVGEVGMLPSMRVIRLAYRQLPPIGQPMRG